MLLKVIAAEYQQAYKISLVFNDGYTATVDLEATIFNDHRPIFAPLKQQDYFKAFSAGIRFVGTMRPILRRNSCISLPDNKSKPLPQALGRGHTP